MPEETKPRRTDPDTKGAWVAATAWFLLFAAGTLVSSEPFRTNLSKPGVGIFAFIGNFLAATVLFTPLNGALLAAMAGWFGGFSSRLRMRHAVGVANLEAQDEPKSLEEMRVRRREMFMMEPACVSMVRGLILYLGIVAGLVVLTGDPFKEISKATTEDGPLMYVRFAASISLIAYQAGFDPTWFEGLVSRIPSLKSAKGGGGGAGKPEDKS